jgi:hypothetical protein
MLDMKLAGRENKLCGSQNARAKLNEYLVYRIKSLLRNDIGIAEISRKFSVSEGCIRLIAQNKTWRHVEI